MKKKQNPITEITQVIGLILISALRSFVFALSQVVWLFAGIFILIGAFLYLNQQGLMTTPVKDIKGLWLLIDLFKQFWGLFFTIIWVWDSWINFKEVSKKL